MLLKADARTLTAGTDVLTGENGGTAGDDVFLAPDTALNQFDQIDGGAGVDTLRVGGDSTEIQGDISGVEVVRIEGDAVASYNTTAVGGLEKLEFVGQQGSVVSVNGLTAGQTVAATNSNGGTNGSFFNLNLSVASGSTANVALNNSVVNLSAASAVADGTIDTLNIESEGDSTLSLSGDPASFTGDLRNVTANVAAEGTLTLDGSSIADGTTEEFVFDGSASQGAIIDTAGVLQYATSVTTGAGDDGFILSSDNETVNTGAGDDIVQIGMGTTLNEDAAIDLGEGYDAVRLVLDGTSASSISADGYEQLNTIEGAEEVRVNLDGGIGSEFTVDMAELDATTLGLDDGAIVTNLTSDDLVKSHVGTNSGYADYQLQAARNDDADAEFSDGGVVNFEATETSNPSVIAANTAAADGSDFDTLNLSGEGAITFDNTGGSAATIDASDLSGGLSFTAGDEAETVTLGEGEDTLNYSAGVSTYASTDTITGFGEGDTIQLSGVDGGDGVSEYDASGAASYEQALSSAAASDADGAWFEFSGSTYVVQNTDGASVTDEASTDTVIELTGVDLGLTADSFTAATV
ncbi:beta strand repeat-containing protein [Halomonas sp. IOP_31]|uniref:beta strand repeat-containing protein n=1 Tax=Halomonas sp. IOP_31 TaxID=2876584 RepID=UPI001E4771F1|nr:hypothetical protein [Halomonas sp. IOP_31]MCD6009918.1 hypothetical protein [Halomonas sp. IOP_31]